MSLFDGVIISWYVVCSLCSLFFFFKQKTAYEMRISDWSSDVCSSDLHLFEQRLLPGPGWKVTMYGYLEAYHHDSVHANTLSKHTIGNLLVHDIFGHQDRKSVV